MSKELDYFIDLHINVENDRVQAEDIENYIEDNRNLIADWDSTIVDIDGSRLEGAIFDIQFIEFDFVSEFLEGLEKLGYEI